jgi:sugar diacid utilization regulator
MIASMAVPHWSPARADEHARPEPAPPDPRPDHTRPDPRPDHPRPDPRPDHARSDHTRPDHGRTEDALVAPRHLDRENAALRELVTVYRYLSGLALQDADLAGVVRLISDRTSATVAVISQLMDVLTAAAPGVPAEKAAADVREHVVHPRLGQVLRASRLSQRALRLPKVGGMPAIIVAPVLVGDEVPNYLITIDPAENLFGEDMSLLVTEHAATICGVILGRERVVAAAARRVRDDLVEGLLLGRGRDNADVGRWAAHLGYDPARNHNVLAIAFDLPTTQDAAAQRQRIWESIEHFVATRAPEAIISARESEVVVVTASPTEAGQVAGPGPGAGPGATVTTGLDARQLAAACLARLAELFPAAKVVIGIGGTCRDPREVARSYAQAQRTTQTLRRLGRAGTAAAFGDLGILRLLLQVPDLAELRSFAADVLGKLSMHEHEHKSEYLTTLACYFRENNSPQRASRILHVHPNTVAYRVKRIEEITGLRLDNYTDRLIAQVALEILDALGDEP